MKIKKNKTIIIVISLLINLLISHKVNAQGIVNLTRIEYLGSLNALRMPPIYIFSENSCLNFDFIEKQTLGSKVFRGDILQGSVFILTNDNFKNYNNKIDSLLLKYALDFDEDKGCFQCFTITKQNEIGNDIKMINILSSDKSELNKNFVRFYNDFYLYIKYQVDYNAFPNKILEIIKQHIYFLEMTYGHAILESHQNLEYIKKQK
jgi:hypothetical protein